MHIAVVDKHLMQSLFLAGSIETYELKGGEYDLSKAGDQDMRES